MVGLHVLYCEFFDGKSLCREAEAGGVTTPEPNGACDPLWAVAQVYIPDRKRFGELEELVHWLTASEDRKTP